MAWSFLQNIFRRRCTLVCLISGIDGPSLRDLRFSPDGKILATADGVAKLWGTDNGHAIDQLKSQGPTAHAISVAFAPDSKTLIVGHWDGSISVWDANRVSRSQLLAGHSSPVNTLAFSPDGAYFASGGHEQDPKKNILLDERILLWDAKRRVVIRELQGHTKGVRQVAFSPTGDILASGGPDGQVILWDISTGEVRHRSERQAKAIHSLAFGGDQLMAASDTVTFFDPNDGSLIKRVVIPSRGKMHKVDISLDGKLLIVGGDSGPMGPGWVQLRDAVTEERMWSTSSTFSVLHVRMSPQKRLFAAADLQQSLWLWRIDH